MSWLKQVGWQHLCDIASQCRHVVGGFPNTVVRQEGCAHRRAETTAVISSWRRLVAVADMQ